MFNAFVPSITNINASFQLNDDEHYYSLLYVACEQGYTKIAKLLLDGAADVNPNGVFRPLSAACKYGDTEIVKLLLAMGARVNTNKNNALHFACEYGHLEIVSLLLKMGAEVNTREETYNEYTPLHFACKYGHLEIARLLLTHGADVSAVEWGGRIPVFFAVITVVMTL